MACSVSYTENLMETNQHTSRRTSRVQDRRCQNQWACQRHRSLESVFNVSLLAPTISLQLPTSALLLPLHKVLPNTDFKTAEVRIAITTIISCSSCPKWCRLGRIPAERNGKGHNFALCVPHPRIQTALSHSCFVIMAIFCR